MSKEITNEEIRKIFEYFIQDEDKFLSSLVYWQDEYEGYYYSNWPKIIDNFKKAPILLDEVKLYKFYFHLIRKSYLPNKDIEKYYKLWESAYKEQTTLMLTSSTNINRIDGLIVYGFDKIIEIDKNKDFSDYLLFREVHKTFNAFVRALNMLEKPKKFIEFSKNEQIVNRLCMVLKSIKFCPDDSWEPKMNDEEINLSLYSEVFWGIIYTLLFSKFSIAKQTINEFTNYKPLLCQNEMLAIFNKFELASKKYM